MTAMLRIATPRAKAASVGQKHPKVAPPFNSRPGAPLTLYLDFVSKFNLDGDNGNFNDDEFAWIAEICERVAEKFSPFGKLKVVTTPSTPQSRVTHVVIIGGSCWDWFGQPAGGVSDIGSFYLPQFDNTSHVFTENLIIGVNDIRVIAETIAHEAGHAFGLGHQLRGGDYDTGTSEVAPVMGCSYDSEYGVWTPADLQQLFAVLGHDADEERPLVDGRASSVISEPGDVDRYTIVGGGRFRGSISVPRGAMSAPTLALRVGQGADSWTAGRAIVGQPLEVTLRDGRYTLEVRGGGIGRYSIEASCERSLRPPKWHTQPVLPDGRLHCQNPDGRPLTFAAAVESLDTVVRKQFGLTFAGDLFYNSIGLEECWLRGNVNEFGNPWYFISRIGTLLAWDGQREGKKVAQLFPACWWRPEIVYHGKSLVQAFNLSLVDGDQFNAFGEGERWLRGDLIGETGNPWYFLTVAGDLCLWSGTPKKLDGILLAKVDPVELIAQTLDLRVPADVQLNWGGRGEKWLTSSLGNCFLLPDGGLHLWDGTPAASGRLLTTLPADVYQSLRFSPVRTAVIADGVLTTEGTGFCVRLTVNDGIFSEEAVWSV